MLDLKRLRVLAEVARRGSFSAAADALYLSQSAVSQQVATLEREVGMSLLERTNGGPKLTDAGRTLVDHGEAAIARLEEAEKEVAAIAGLEGGELRIASFPTASAVLLTEALAEFSASHPDVRLSVTEAEPEESLPVLHAAELVQRGGGRDVSRGGLRAADRVRERRVPGASGVCGGGPRIHAAPGSRPADPEVGPRHPSDQAGRPEAPGVGGNAGRGRALARDRGDGRDARPGRRARRRGRAEAGGLSYSAAARRCDPSSLSGERSAVSECQRGESGLL